MVFKYLPSDSSIIGLRGFFTPRLREDAANALNLNKTAVGTSISDVVARNLSWVFIQCPLM
jgi:hypothetical protein